MENKKIIIITIVLFLIAGTGTFVFATSQGDIKPDDIDYRPDKEPTYQKVDDNKKGQNVPVIENNTTIDNGNYENSNNGTTNNGDNNIASGNTNPNKPNNSSSSSNNNTNRPIYNNGNNTSENSNNTSNEIINDNNNVDTNTDNNDNNEEENNTVPLTASVSYSNIELTNQNVLVTITANKAISVLSESDWTVAENIATKEFSSNTLGKQEVVIYDNENNSKILDYQINNIDKTQPSLKVSYSETDKTYKPIVVTITSDKKIKGISEEGWVYIDDVTIEKEFTENTEGKNVIIYDLAGNSNSIDYKIDNYYDEPNLSIDKSGNNSITITYKNPIGNADKWIECDDGYQISIPTGNRLKNSTTLENDGIEVLISNVNENGKAVKSNTPVIITIKANRELKPLEGWILSENKKSIIKMFASSTKGTLNIKCEDGTSFDNVAYNVSYLDTVKPVITKIEVSDSYTVNIILSEYSLINDGIGWGQMKTFIGTKTYSKDDLNGKKEIIETITLKDNYDNINSQQIKVIYDDIADKIMAEIVEVNDKN